MSKGGKRPGSGRKKGKAPKTLEKIKVLEALRQRTYKVADAVFGAQLSSALGQQFLFRIKTNSKGFKEKPELVEDELTIRNYLNRDFETDGDLYDKNEYYFITTKAPDTRAIDSMFDRAFGKVSQPLGGGEDGTGPIQVQIINYAKKNADNKTTT